MFLLSNLERAGFDDQGHKWNGTYAGAFEGQALVGVACHYRMGNLIVNDPRYAVAVARAATEASRRRIHGVVGPAPQVEAIAAALSLPTGDATRLDDAEGLYRLELAQLRVPEALSAGTVHGRALEQTDLDFVTEWTVRYRVEETREIESAELRRVVRAELEGSARGDVWVLERDGELLARTGFNARLSDAVQIGGVWTPHALRGRGYARCVIASHLLAAREAGVTTAILFTSDSNGPARRVYAALGFRAVGRYRLLLLLREPIAVQP